MKKTHLFTLILILLLFVGCAESPAEPSEDEQKSYVYAMDTVMTLRAYGENAQSALGTAAGAIESLSDELSVTSEGSFIYRLNQNSDKPLELSDTAAEIVSRALQLCEQTGGALDISIYPVVKTWGFTTGEYHIPTKQELDALLARVDYSGISLDGNLISIQPGMQIDLGSVVKGYTGDMVAEILKNEGVQSAVLDLGGNVRLIGNNTNGAPWRIGIQDPLNESEYFGILSASDKSVVTSGGYNRFFVEDDKTYWHIIDPETGYPADSGIISVTIVGDDGLMCDGLSTAVFILGKEKALEFWREHGGFEMLLVSNDGYIYITPELEKSFELLPSYSSDYTVEVIK